MPVGVPRYRAGHTVLADEISQRFRALCAEIRVYPANFDARNKSAGLRDRAYTWTASSYLILSGRVRSAAAPPTSDQSPT